MDTVQLHNTTSCTVGGDYTPQSSCDKVIGSLGIGLKQKTLSIRDIKIIGYNSILIGINVICTYHIHLLEVEPAGSKKDVLKYNIGYSIQLYSTPQIVNIFCTMPNPRLVPSTTSKTIKNIFLST